MNTPTTISQVTMDESDVADALSSELRLRTEERGEAMALALFIAEADDRRHIIATLREVLNAPSYAWARAKIERLLQRLENTQK